MTLLSATSSAIRFFSEASCKRRLQATRSTIITTSTIPVLRRCCAWSPCFGTLYRNRRAERSIRDANIRRQYDQTSHFRRILKETS